MTSFQGPDHRRRPLGGLGELFGDQREPSFSAPVPVFGDPHVDAESAAAALTKAQQRAAEQRIAAERALEQARALEARLAAEAEQARTAQHRARLARVSADAERARRAEQDAVEQTERCAAEHARTVDERNDAEAQRRDAQTAKDAAAADLAALEERLTEARGALRRANTVCAETARRLEAAAGAEQAARDRAATAAQTLAQRHAERERFEAELAAVTDGSAPLPALPAIEPAAEPQPLHAANAAAARRAAERRAADAARARSSLT